MGVVEGADWGCREGLLVSVMMVSFVENGKLNKRRSLELKLLVKEMMKEDHNLEATL